MTFYITQQQRTSDPISINFPQPFEQAPAVLVTPFWKGETTSVGSIETVKTPVTAAGCKITSGNQDPNYWVNVLAIDTTEPALVVAPDNGQQSLSIGKLGVTAGVHAKMQAGLTTINFATRLKSNDPVVLLAPQWTSPVGYTECLVGSAASEISTYSQNMASGGAYSIEYLAADRGASSFRDPSTSFTQIETGTCNKTGSGIYRVYFQSRFSVPPIVFLSPWWNGTQGNLGSIETLLDVTNEYFDAISGNAASNYFVNWVAFGNT
jgi:hypothetical protein